jgi:hypothetical protein
MAKPQTNREIYEAIERFAHSQETLYYRIKKHAESFAYEPIDLQAGGAVIKQLLNAIEKRSKEELPELLSYLQLNSKKAR